MKAAIYMRVSTKDQTIENQREALTSWVRERGWDPVEYVDEGISGTQADRPAYQQMLADARQGKLDVVVAYRLDRLGRSMTQLLVDVERLSQWGVDVATYASEVDTTGPWGKLQLAVFSALAEIERDIISERTKAAYERKKANGESDWGRPKAQVPRWLLEAVADGELTQKAAADKAGVSRTTIRNRVRTMEAQA